VEQVALAGTVTAALAGYAWKRHSEPGTTAFAALMVTTTVWSGGYALGLVTMDPGLRRFWLSVEWTTIPLVPVAWLAFALAYAGWGHLLTRRTVGLLSMVPLVTVALAWTNPLHGLFYVDSTRSAVGTVLSTGGPVYWIHVVYSVLLVVGAAAILLRVASRARTVDQPGFATLAAVIALPGVLELLHRFGAFPVALTSTGVALSGLALLMGLRMATRFLQGSIPLTAQQFSLFRLMAIGLVLILIIRFRPQGLWGDAKELGVDT
jgi:hypothetical protein